MLHLVGFLLTLNYDARNHKLKIYLTNLTAPKFTEHNYNLPCITPLCERVGHTFVSIFTDLQ